MPAARIRVVARRSIESWKWSSRVGRDRPVGLAIRSRRPADNVSPCSPMRSLRVDCAGPGPAGQPPSQSGWTDRRPAAVRIGGSTARNASIAGLRTDGRHELFRRSPPVRPWDLGSRVSRRGARLLRRPDGDALRKLQRRHLADSPRAPAGVPEHLRVLPLVGRPGRRSRRSRSGRSSYLSWWRGELRAMYQGEARHPVMIALAETVERHGIPDRPVRGLDIGLRARPDGHRISDVRAVARLLHAVGQPRGTSRLVRCRRVFAGKRPTGRRDLHGASTGQFLAGRRPRPGHRPDLFATRGSGSIRLSRVRSAGLAIHARVRRADAVRGRAGSRSLVAEGRALVPRIPGRVGRRRRPVFPRRFGHPRPDRGTRV